MSKVFITGATSGLGRSIAGKFLAAGKDVYLHGRNPDNIRDLLSSPRCHFYGYDLLDLDRLGELTALIRREEIDCFFRGDVQNCDRLLVFPKKDSKAVCRS